MVEAAAEGDDSLLEKYLEGGELTAEEINRGLANVVQNNTFIPVLVSSASAEIGIAPFLDALINLMPSPVAKKPVIAKGKGREALKAMTATVVL